MKHKYGYFSSKQFSLTKKEIRKQIFFLLLCADPDTKGDYPYVDLCDAFYGLLRKLGGLNSILGEPKELVDIISLLEAALMEYNDCNFDFKKYRRLVLCAGALVNEIQEVD